MARAAEYSHMSSPWQHILSEHVLHYITKWVIGHTHSLMRHTHPQLRNYQDNTKSVCHCTALPFWDIWVFTCINKCISYIYIWSVRAIPTYRVYQLYDYKPPKAAKKTEVCNYRDKNSCSSTFHIWKLCIFWKCLVCIHIQLATPSSVHGFVFRWHASYTLLCHLQQLICSCFGKLLSSMKFQLHIFPACDCSVLGCYYIPSPN